MFATNGKFYTLDVAKLPGGRGYGEPIRMIIDLEQDAAIVSLFVNKGGRKFLVATTDGHGFVVNEDDCVGNTRKGKQVMNVDMPVEACAIATVAGDTVAVIGTNHKMVLFPLEQVPEMARGRGVRLQKYSGGKLSDVTVFDAKAGLTWKDSAGRDQSMTMKELSDWRGNRADAGRLATACRSRTSSCAAWSKAAVASSKNRHARPCAGHPCLITVIKTWMAGHWRAERRRPSVAMPAMTRQGRRSCAQVAGTSIGSPSYSRYSC